MISSVECLRNHTVTIGHTDPIESEAATVLSKSFGLRTVLSLTLGQKLSLP